MIRHIIDWWLELERVHRFVLSSIILLLAFARWAFFDQVWITAWVVGGMLFALTVLRVGEDEPL